MKDRDDLINSEYLFEIFEDYHAGQMRLIREIISLRGIFEGHVKYTLRLVIAGARCPDTTAHLEEYFRSQSRPLIVQSAARKLFNALGEYNLLEYLIPFLGRRKISARQFAALISDISLKS